MDAMDDEIRRARVHLIVRAVYRGARVLESSAMFDARGVGEQVRLFACDVRDHLLITGLARALKRGH